MHIEYVIASNAPASPTAPPKTVGEHRIRHYEKTSPERFFFGIRSGRRCNDDSALLLIAGAFAEIGHEGADNLE